MEARLIADIAVAALGVVGAGIALRGKFLERRERLRAEQAERELKFQQVALDFPAFVEEWSGFHAELQSLFNETEIDRFLILRAWNGELSPRWTTAVYQFRQGSQAPISYVHFELDSDYIDRLREIVVRNIMHFQVSDIPDSAIRRVYEAEGVTAAIWCLVGRMKRGKRSRSITYCSFATHSKEPLSITTVTRCGILAGRLKGMALTFTERSGETQ